MQYEQNFSQSPPAHYSYNSEAPYSYGTDPNTSRHEMTMSNNFFDQQRAMEKIPVAELPLYELPPSFVPRSERRLHQDYCNDLKKFQNRTVHLQRSKPSDQLGFNVRGGAEHKCGIFISKVMPRTNAHRAGLQEGDQILFANGESFLNIDQNEAVKSLKRYVDVELVVKYFPYAYDKSFDKCKTTPTST